VAEQDSENHFEFQMEMQVHCFEVEDSDYFQTTRFFCYFAVEEAQVLNSKIY